MWAAVQVDVTGNSSAGARSHAAFHASDGRAGTTTLSASGLLLLPPPSPQSQAQQQQQHQQPVLPRVLAPLSVVHAFLRPHARRNPAAAAASSSSPDDLLLPGTELRVQLRCGGGDAEEEGGDGGPQRLVAARARLARLVPLPAVRAAAEELLAATAASGDAWRFGWLLAEGQPAEAATPAVLGHCALLEVVMAGRAGEQQQQQQQQQEEQQLRRAVEWQHKQRAALRCGGCASCTSSSSRGRGGGGGAACSCCARVRPGLPVAVEGSPFGCLAPHQLSGAVVTGVVSSAPLRRAQQAWPLLPPPLFVVDARCLPGMEGGVVTCRACGRCLGLLALPLSCRASRVELMLAVGLPHAAPALIIGAAAGFGECIGGKGGDGVAAAASSDAGRRGGSNDGGGGGRPLHAGALAAAPAAAADAVASTTGGGIVCRSDASSSSSGGLDAAALDAAAAGVVLVRHGRSWASGVLLSPCGLVLTVAHLFRQASAAAGGGASGGGSGGSTSRAGTCGSCVELAPTDARRRVVTQRQQEGRGAAEDLAASVRVTLPPRDDGDSKGGSSGGDTYCWLPARVLRVFTGHLDAAVLQLQPGALGAALRPRGGALRPLRLAPAGERPREGDAVAVVGHGLFGTALAWPPAVTAGCAARVVRLPPLQARGATTMQTPPPPLAAAARDSMVIATAGVHAGASGGALLDGRGRLCGLVTSNARHASGATLPHLSFCVAADELAPLVRWAAARAAGGGGEEGEEEEGGRERGGGGGGSMAALRALDRDDDDAGARLWALQPPPPPSPQLVSRL